jgi:hypothetical protein
MESERQEASKIQKTCDEKLDFLRNSLLMQFFICEYMHAIIINLLVSVVHSRAPIIERMMYINLSAPESIPLLKGVGAGQETNIF